MIDPATKNGWICCAKKPGHKNHENQLKIKRDAPEDPNKMVFGLHLTPS